MVNKYSPYPGDVIDAKLEPGEYVVNRNAVKAIGKKNLDRLNNKVAPRFQEGGQAGGVAEQNASKLRRAKAMVPGYNRNEFAGNKSKESFLNSDYVADIKKDWRKNQQFESNDEYKNYKYQNWLKNPNHPANIGKSERESYKNQRMNQTMGSFADIRRQSNQTFIDLQAIDSIPTNPEFNTDDFNKVLGPMSQNMREYKDNSDQYQRQVMRAERKWYQKKIPPTPAEIAQMARVDDSLKQSKQKDAFYQQEMAVRSQSEKRSADARDAQQRHSSSQIADNMRSFQRQSEMMELGSGPKAPIDPKTGERHMTVAEGFGYDSKIAGNRNALIEKQRAAQKAKHDAIMASKMDGPEPEVQVVGNKWSPPPYEKVKQNDSGERKSGGLGAAYRNFKAGMQVKKYGKQDGGYIPEDGKQGYLIGGLALGATALGALGKGKQSFEEAGGMAGIREKIAQRKADKEAAYLASTDRDIQATAANTNAGKTGAAVMGAGQAIAGGVRAVGDGLKYARDENRAENFDDVMSGKERGSLMQRGQKGLGFLGNMLQDASQAQGFKGADWSNFKRYQGEKAASAEAKKTTGIETKSLGMRDDKMFLPEEVSADVTPMEELVNEGSVGQLQLNSDGLNNENGVSTSGITVNADGTANENSSVSGGNTNILNGSPEITDDMPDFLKKMIDPDYEAPVPSGIAAPDYDPDALAPEFDVNSLTNPLGLQRGGMVSLEGFIQQSWRNMR